LSGTKITTKACGKDNTQNELLFFIEMITCAQKVGNQAKNCIFVRQFMDLKLAIRKALYSDDFMRLTWYT